MQYEYMNIYIFRIYFKDIKMCNALIFLSIGWNMCVRHVLPLINITCNAIDCSVRNTNRLLLIYVLVHNNILLHILVIYFLFLKLLYIIAVRVSLEDVRRSRSDFQTKIKIDYANKSFSDIKLVADSNCMEFHFFERHTFKYNI